MLELLKKIHLFENLSENELEDSQNLCEAVVPQGFRDF